MSFLRGISLIKVRFDEEKKRPSESLISRASLQGEGKGKEEEGEGEEENGKDLKKLVERESEREGVKKVVGGERGSVGENEIEQGADVIDLSAPFYVCDESECQEKATFACVRRHPQCGHLCGGVLHEITCLPCILDDCVEKRKETDHPPSSSSSSSSSPISSSPSISLSSPHSSSSLSPSASSSTSSVQLPYPLPPPCYPSRLRLLQCVLG